MGQVELRQSGRARSVVSRSVLYKIDESIIQLMCLKILSLETVHVT